MSDTALDSPGTDADGFYDPAADPNASAPTPESDVIDPASAEAPDVAAGTDAAGSDADTEDKARRPRGWLESDVKALTDKFVTGEITVDEGQFLTPHRIARLIQKDEGLEKPPSTGAVAAVLNRWVEIGFIQTNDKPFAFVDYTDAGRDQGLAALKAARSENRKAARKAAKEAEASAAPASEPTTGTENDPATTSGTTTTPDHTVG